MKKTLAQWVYRVLKPFMKFNIEPRRNRLYITLEVFNEATPATVFEWDENHNLKHVRVSLFDGTMFPKE